MNVIINYDLYFRSIANAAAREKISIPQTTHRKPMSLVGVVSEYFAMPEVQRTVPGFIRVSIRVIL